MVHLLWTLAQQDNSDNAAAAGTAMGFGIFGCCFAVFYFAVLAAIIVGMWKVFTKARQPGWASLVPIFNVYILCIMAGKPAWWVLLFFIPIVSFIVYIIICLELAKFFGKSVAFAIGMSFLPFIFFPLLGFSNATYSGPAKPFST